MSCHASYLIQFISISVMNGLCLGLEFVTYVSNDDVMCLSSVFGWVKYLSCYIKRGGCQIYSVMNIYVLPLSAVMCVTQNSRVS